MKIYDAAIIGSGPAGLSAALNLKLHNKEIIWFGAKNFSTKVEKSEKIANYPGMGFISGAELVEKFAAHAEKCEIIPENSRLFELFEQYVVAVLVVADYFSRAVQHYAHSIAVCAERIDDRPFFEFYLFGVYRADEIFVFYLVHPVEKGIFDIPHILPA